MNDMPGQRVETSYHDAKQAFIALWQNKGVPTDLRLYMCGIVQAAGARQGDEVFPREIMEKILVRDELTRSEIVSMVENVHKFVILRDGLRVQYLLIAVHMITKYLDRNLETAIAEIAKNN